MQKQKPIVVKLPSPREILDAYEQPETSFNSCAEFCGFMTAWRIDYLLDRAHADADHEGATRQRGDMEAALVYVLTNGAQSIDELCDGLLDADEFVYDTDAGRFIDLDPKCAAQISLHLRAAYELGERYFDGAPLYD